MNYSMAVWKIEMGKHQLIQGEYEAARKSIDEAIKNANGLKLKIINWLLLIAPELVRLLFIKFRPGEVFFIHTAASYKRKTV